MTGQANSPEPELIQGGMGVAISSWQLARAVAETGERIGRPVLGVVSGTGLAIATVLRLRKGDSNTRRALEAFPVPEVAQGIIERYWLNTGRSSRSRIPPKPEILVNGSDEQKADLAKLLIVANFAEVWLAKQGHSGPVGVNYLEKIQLPRLPEIFGAMLGGVDYVLMGAGIPNQVPGVLDDLASWKEASYKIDVAGSEKYVLSFDPKTIIAEQYRMPLTRPRFLAIVSHHALAQALALKATGEVDGFVVEGPIAGGHNAPARGKEISESGEPIYGERDKPDLAKIRGLGKPFWLAGGYASPEKLDEAKSTGAAGIQVGSAFALCDESGLRDDIKRELKRKCYSGDIEVIANPVVSPSGFPFQVVRLEGSLSDPVVYGARRRSCSLGYLAEAYRTTRGGIGFRCPAEPVKAYVKKGGDADSAPGRVCLCNGLAAASKDGQRTEAASEPPIVTLGQDHSFIRSMLASADGSYSAEDVIRSILSLAPSGHSEERAALSAGSV
jgi:NAD(P)H-dependent flavin oxidoreductase YrpB (nitropropane dioxygenase family)